MNSELSNFARCPVPGAGVHSWMMGAANRCRAAGFSQAEAERFIAGQMTRPPKPANEISIAIAKAYRTAPPTNRSGNRQTWGHIKTPVPITNIKFDPAKLATVAARITAPANWRHWLWERSPIRPETQNAFSFLTRLYAPSERVLVFDKMDTKFPLGCVEIDEPMDCRVPALIRNGGNYGNGIWFLSNPVDGHWHDTGEKDKDPGKPIMSCRNWQAVTAFRYAVLESDQAPLNLWLSFVAQLPIRVSALYSSGGRSLHALLRLDAHSKAEWDALVAPLKRPLKVLGADPGALSAVRLTRLPGCWRPEKRGFQRLLYLCPNPPDVALMDMPPLVSRHESLARWKSICPRWNPGMEAFE